MKKMFKLLIPLSVLFMATSCGFQINNVTDSGTGSQTGGNTGGNTGGQTGGNTGGNTGGQTGGQTTTKGAWTILLYMCGSNLESDLANQTQIEQGGYTYQHDGIGLATADILEILDVKNQPSDVNIVIQTGGAQTWTSNTYGKYSDGYDISNKKLQRHHVKNNKIVLDEELTYTSMGSSSTLQSFLEFGLKNYPAEKTGVILWNHGGGMQGVCFDDKKNGDGLLASEVTSAVSGALKNTGNSGKKLEWIGYDACLMQVQDIAEKNSAYFNYMVGSQETEAGYGWDYDTWVDDLYSKKSTETILKAIVDGFIEDNGGTASSYIDGYVADQTLSYLDLSKMAAYKSAWESLATQLKSKLSSSNKSKFISLVSGCKKFAGDDSYAYGLVDASNFISSLSSNSTFKPATSYITNVQNAYKDLVKYSVAQKGAGKANGLSFYFPFDEYTSSYNDYNSSETNFTNWKYICDNYGEESSGGWWY